MKYRVGAKATGESWRDHYQTPPYILDCINKMWRTGWFDPCPIHPTLDGLNTPWQINAFINPPFSEYKKWVEHGLKQFAPQVWLANTSNSSSWFKALMDKSSAICFLNDRIKFIDPQTGKPTKTTLINKSQCLIYRGYNPTKFAAYFRHLGHVWHNPAYLKGGLACV